MDVYCEKCACCDDKAIALILEGDEEVCVDDDGERFITISEDALADLYTKLTKALAKKV